MMRRVLEASAQSLEQRVALALEARRPELAELVRHAIDAELERLVDAELAALVEVESTNGATPIRVTPAAVTPPARSCAECGQRPAAPGRRVCNGCRSRERRRARAVAPVDDDGPRRDV
jgi:hypothetical protein